mmetsp:Transcript_37679/g.63332  ORF Transcript_37679/g.63332 Transcript_37679/m.63332 type:complete len:114 (+) Transcript_37679:54-395(+)
MHSSTCSLSCSKLISCIHALKKAWHSQSSNGKQFIAQYFQTQWSKWMIQEHCQCVELKRSMFVNLAGVAGEDVRIFMTRDVAWIAWLQLFLEGMNVIEVCSSKPYPFPVVMAS